MRIKLQGEYRSLYAYIGELNIVILHFFRKKTQKTPIKNLELAQRRLRLYE
ncbi:MAG: type II toxin-antitoxin system RelE/ParE family toxin [Candidatus Levybacteria bacterium]|nr:type II toxin-antitoxin system RelE/ParE family toxin [Candidatus Levybacteria bacterium]